MNKDNISKLTMDELASCSPWPARILSIDPFEIKHKTPEAIIREFGDDKWGALLKFFADKNDFTLADVEAKEQNLDELIPSNFKSGSRYKRTGKAGIFAGSLELAKEGNLSIKQEKLFDDIYVKEVSD